MQSNQDNNLRELYQRMTERAAPSPWRAVPVHVGGVTAVGFGQDSEWLLVVTHSGLGVIDATTGLVAARVPEDSLDDDDPYPIRLAGIGPLAGQQVPLAGLWGGGLRTTSRDGWVIHRISPSWPCDSAVLCSPDHPELDDHLEATMLLKDLDPPIRGLGFSDSGRSLVVATSSLYLWTRDEPGPPDP